jgi:aspartyl-tRNA(Asn)/glutamyl-tRNA(Gln) amidotransferase subunit A
MESKLLEKLSGAEMARLIAKKELSPVELTEAYLERIEKIDPKIGAYITVTGEYALKEAKKAERAAAKGEKLGPLHGLPIALKDQFDTKGIKTTSGSRSLDKNIPKQDATTVERVKKAGAIIIGKTQMTQFATGMPDPYQYKDPPRNVWDLERDPLGSSTGSAMAIAASMAATSLGEDTGGSIRCPSSANGVVGLRPTWGRVSRHGVIPLSWSMDQAGPITRTVEDAAIMMNVIAGYDPRDVLTSRLPVPDYTKSLKTSLKGMRVAVVKELTDENAADPVVSKAVRKAADHLAELGAELDEVSLPMLPDAIAVAGAVTGSDSAYVHYKGIREDPENYGRTLRMRLVANSLIPSQVLHKANKIRELLRRHWLALFEKNDVLLSPTLMYQVNKIRCPKVIKSQEELVSKFGTGSGDSTVHAAFLGTPAISVPCGFDTNGVPIGLMVMGDRFQEEKILRVAHAYERSTDWHKKRPKL